MKLSIITINYNNLKGLKITAESVLSQTWRDFEWIIIDGGSNDGSKEYIESLAIKPEANISYWCSEPDKGIYNAMNKGISQSKGEYLNFMNSGDCYATPDILDIVFEKKHSADVIYGDCNYVKGENKFVTVYPSQITLFHLLNYSICHQATFIKSNLFYKQQYREDLKIVSDWAMVLKWYLEGVQFEHIDLIVADYDNFGISSTDIKLCKIERKKVISKELDEHVITFINNYNELYRSLLKFEDYHYTAAYNVINSGRKFLRKPLKLIITMFDRINKLI